MIISLFPTVLNSKLVKIDGKVTEQVYKENGLYKEAIER